MIWYLYWSVLLKLDSMEAIIKQKWPLVRKDDFRKTTRDLREILCSPAEMASSSVSGAKGHTGSTKAALDPWKGALIICEFDC